MGSHLLPEGLHAAAWIDQEIQGKSTHYTHLS
jgi:hypothetical protein